MKQRKHFCKMVRQRKSIDPITCFEKNYYHSWNFKHSFKKCDPSGKIAELIRLSNIKLINKNQTYYARRQKKHPIKKCCWVCKDKAFYQHHIIGVKNGGYDCGFNRIPICDKCHELIHPWMATSIKEEK